MNKRSSSTLRSLDAQDGSFRPWVSGRFRAFIVTVMLTGLLAMVTGLPEWVAASESVTEEALTSDDTSEIESDSGQSEVVVAPESTAEPTLEPTPTTIPPTEAPVESVVLPSPTMMPPTNDLVDEQILTPTSVATTVPVADVALTMTVSCTVDGTYAGGLTLATTNAPAIVTDIIALLVSGETNPVRLNRSLPRSLSDETADWSWWFKASSINVPAALLVHLADHPGDDEVNRLVGDGRSGWLMVEPTAAVESCQLPTPESDSATSADTDDDTSGGVGEDVEPIEPSTPFAETDMLEPTVDAIETQPAGTPTPKATETPTALDESVDLAETVTIEARTDDRAVKPLTAARYRFRVTNTLDTAINVRLVTSDSAEGWTSTLYQVDAVTGLPETLNLAAGEAITVVVRVYPPVDGRLGETNTTSLDVFSVDLVGEDAH